MSARRGSAGDAPDCGTYKCLGGVRPSSGAASAEKPDMPSFIAARLLPNVPAPEDGRTPPTSRPPSLTHYRVLRHGVEAGRADIPVQCH